MKKEMKSIDDQIEKLREKKKALRVGQENVEKSDALILLEKLVKRMQKENNPFFWNGGHDLVVNYPKMGIGSGDYFDMCERPFDGNVKSIERKFGCGYYFEDKVDCPHGWYQYKITFSRFSNMIAFLKLTKLTFKFSKDITPLIPMADHVYLKTDGIKIV